jgi:CheY-like chemotaxis protein
MARILVVEDDPDRLEFVLETLTRQNVELQRELARRGLVYPKLVRSDLIVASDADTALKSLGSGTRFDLILLDLHLPRKPGVPAPGPEVLYGFEILEFVRTELHSLVPVIVLSVNVDPSSWERSHGLRRHGQVLNERRIHPADDILLKEPAIGGGGGFGVDSDLLQRKLVGYLVDLSEQDELCLERAGIRVPATGSKSREVLRQLKRFACSSLPGYPRPDVLLLGENGVGKTTFARAYHLFRPHFHEGPRLGFEHLDLGSIDFAGSAPNIALFGATDFNGAWSLGAFARSTLFRRQGRLKVFPGQLVEEEIEIHPVSGELGLQSYPTGEDEPDFDASGTLFLDEVVNIGRETQGLLLQALSYDLRNRHIYTTGHSPRRLRVGPTLIFATAQRIGREEVTEEREERPVWRGMEDYRFRIDQRRVIIPPLRERREEIVELLQTLVERRTGRPKIPIEPNILEMFTERLEFYNNVADLQRIADQVNPEEPSISWRHVRPLYMRENPVLPTIELAESAWDRTVCARYLEEVESTGRVVPLSRIAKEKKTTNQSAYRVALLFLERCGSEMTHRWPSNEETEKFFGHDTARFRTTMARLQSDPNKPHGMREVLKALEKFKR